jgi:putative FmdB family regulatory protein
MPLAEYECQKCGAFVEILYKGEPKTTHTCPKCGARMQRVMSVTNFTLKGTGWAKDNYSKPREPK